MHSPSARSFPLTLALLTRRFLYLIHHGGRIEGLPATLTPVFGQSPVPADSNHVRIVRRCSLFDGIPCSLSAFQDGGFSRAQGQTKTLM